jgi:hypothetical protein
MSRRVKKLHRCLAVAAVIGGAVWVWHGANRTHRTGTLVGHAEASTAPQSEVRPAPIESIQLHLIPRSQPTPLSPSFRSPRPPE